MYDESDDSWDSWHNDMDEAKFTLARARASETLFNDFRAIAEATTPEGAPRYAMRPTLLWLARVLVGQGTGPNRDSAIFELCHLALFVEAACFHDENRDLFFFGQKRVSTSIFRSYFDDRKAQIASCGAPISMSANGISLNHDGSFFEVRFARMPALVCLYEFLASMDSFKYYESINNIFFELNRQIREPEAAREATQTISALVRQYRVEHLPNERQREKFTSLIIYLKDRHPNSDVIDISDDDLMNFWRLHAETKGFRNYRNVFDAFVKFIQAYSEEIWIQGIENSRSLGANREFGEVEPDTTSESIWATQEWTSPLEILDTEPANRINHFKKSSERDPLEPLMEYGPYAVNLPIAFLRYETFGQIQTEISNDLRLKRGAESIRRRIGCEDAKSYSESKSRFDHLSKHVTALQKASLYALHSVAKAPLDQNIIEFPGSRSEVTNAPELSAEDIETLLNDAKRVFRAMTRKGFDEKSLQEDNSNTAEAFRASAGALTATSSLLSGFIDKLESLNTSNPNLTERFELDRESFCRQFEKMYGDHA